MTRRCNRACVHVRGGRWLSLGFFSVLAVLLTAVPSHGEDVAALVQKIKPAVVTIVAYDRADATMPTGIGTGFFVADNRLVTNWHVVRNAQRIEFRDAEGKSHGVRGLVGRDIGNDLAVLVPEEGYKPGFTLSLHPQQPNMGTRVYVLGSPLGLEYTLSDGLVSSVREFQERKVLQITAAISPGSSGSPVFDREGRVLGVATFYVQGGQSLNFAIPVAALDGLMQGAIQPIPQATRDNTPQRGPQAQEDPADRLFTYLAGKYVQAMKDQNTKRPTLRFGTRDGSVGHYDTPFRILQITSPDSALVHAVDERGRPTMLFFLSGVDFRNQQDGGTVRMKPESVLAQITTYRYRTPNGTSNTVYAVEWLNHDRFVLGLRRAMAPQFTQLGQLGEELAKLEETHAELQSQLREAMDKGRDIDRALDLKQQIDMYKPAMKGRANLEQLVARLEAELATLKVDDGAIAQHRRTIETLRRQINENVHAQRRLTDDIKQHREGFPPLLELPE